MSAAHPVSRSAVILSLLLGWFSSAGRVAADGDDLAKLERTYREESAALIEPVTKLNDQYRQALENLQRRIQDAGDLESALKVRDEIRRHEAARNPGASDSDFEDLANLQRIYRLNHAAKQKEYEINLTETREAYRQSLEALAKQFAEAGEDDKADAVLEAYQNIDQATGGGAEAFERRLEAEDFERRLSEARVEHDYASIKQQDRSPYGAIVVEVTPGGVAEGLGIRPGDRLTQIGDVELWYQYLDWKVDLPDRMLQWEDGDGESHQAEVGPGKIGVEVSADLTQHLYYLRSGNRKPIWDDLILTAFFEAERDPELAETALHRAFSLGYQADASTDAAGILIALRENDPDRALRFARHLLEMAGEDPGKIPMAYYPNYFRACLAGGQLDLLKDAEEAVGKTLSGQAFDDDAELLTHWTEAGPEWNPAERPSATLDVDSLEDVFDRRQLVSEERKKVRVVDDYPSPQIGPDKHEVEPGHFSTTYHHVDGGIQHAVWEVAFEAAATSGKPEDNRFLPCIEFMISDYAHEPGLKSLVRVRLADFPGKYPAMRLFSNGERAMAPSFLTDWKAGPTEVRLIKQGNEVEIQVNGATVLWLPLDPDEPVADLGFWVKIVGMKVEFQRSHLWRLEE
ncbi:MAG: hypothetical protein KDN19_21100 [Verrucomicrobiae bacterium]|nr:hypothetical protein [Verrucomicrobiae bacterium]